MIQQLSLHNFKCFEETTFDFAPLTLLSGLNGTGKSSVIQSLALLRQSYQQRLLEENELALNGDLVQLGTAQDILYENAQGNQISLGIKWDNGKTAFWLFDYLKDRDVLTAVSPNVSSEVFNESLFTDHFQYLQAERIGPRSSFQTSDYQTRQHRQLGIQGEYTGHFLSLFGRDDIHLDKLRHDENEPLKLRDQVEAWMSEVSPGTRIQVTPHPGIDLVSLEYSFINGQLSSNTYRSTNVGFGITYTLPIIVSILSSNTDSLLLIENPEAHLHPKGQVQIAKLISLAASCGVQIIVETHSDHILNGIRLSVHGGILPPEDVRLYFFERDVDNEIFSHSITSPTINRDGRIDKWPKNFFDEMNRSLGVLLQPAKK